MHEPNPILETALSRAADAVSIARRAAGQRQDKRYDDLAARFDAGAAIERLSRELPLEGLEREVHDENMRRGHVTSTVNATWLPWRGMRAQRTADTVAVAAQGGYLVDSSVWGAADALRPNLVVGQLGATIATDLVGNVSIPRGTGAATAYWLTAESTQTTGSNQALGQASLAPKTVGGYTEISRLLLKQSSALSVVNRDLTAVVSRAADLAYLSGTGAAGAPVGILNSPGVGAVTGTTFALATAMSFVTDIGDALDDSCGWATNRGVAIALRQRLESTYGAPIWQGSPVAGQLAGFPARSTSALAANTAIFGAWRSFIVGLWGPGLEIAVNPVANFQAAIVGVRCLLTTDAAMLFPSAFAQTGTFT